MKPRCLLAKAVDSTLKTFIGRRLITMKRRDFMKHAAWLTLASSLPTRAATNEPGRSLRIGLTPVFLDDQAAFLNRWRDYLSRKTGLTVTFVQRLSYREISEQVNGGALDLAWMCGHPYLIDRQRLKLLATPLYQGKPEYHAYLIVRHGATDVASIDDLAGKVFAFSDPSSFSGSLYPRFLLHRAGHTPDRFFRRSFFTWSHRKVVEAVAAGLADGGSVAGHVWETLTRIHPEITARTRVVLKSAAYGFPPFVARADLDPSIFDVVQRVFLDMRADAQGMQYLQTLNLDGFVPGEDEMYASIGEMARLVGHY